MGEGSRKQSLKSSQQLDREILLDAGLQQMVRMPWATVEAVSHLH